MKKITTAAALLNKVKKEKVEKKPKGGDGSGVKSEEIDEFDALIEGGAKGPKGTPPSKAEPKKRAVGGGRKKKEDGGDGLKQPKLNFNKGKGVSFSNS